MQPLDLFLAQSNHLIAIAELQRLRLAGGHAGRGHAVGDAVGAAGALVDDRLVKHAVTLVARHVEGAHAVAVLAAHALVLVHLDETRVIVAHERAARADGSARGVGAVLTGAAPESPLHRLDLAVALKLVERDDQTRGAVDVGRVLVGSRPLRRIGLQGARKVVPALAGNLAALAGGALGGIEVNRFFSHDLSSLTASRC